MDILRFESKNVWKELSNEELKQAIIDSGYEPKPQNMKHIMSYVKDKYPAADGGKVIEIIKQMN